jgi:hypothetical protein
MKRIHAIYRWLVVLVLMVFALQEVNGGRFPSIGDQFWTSWAAFAARPWWDFALGLAFLLAAVCVLARIEVARWFAVTLLSYACLRGLILCVSSSSFLVAGSKFGDAGAAAFCIMLVITGASDQRRSVPAS